MAVMSQGMSQQAKMSQQLRMTPQLQQAIKLLQLSRMELINLVRQEMVENPVLEEAHESYEPSEARREPEQAAPEKTEQTAEVKADDAGAMDQVDWERYLENYSGPSPANNYKGLSTDDLPGLEQTLSTEVSLYDHLNEQLRLSELDDEEFLIGAMIIGNLDEGGYLKTTSEEISDDLQIDVEVVEDILFMVQQFDPLGVAARDLRECLLIQAGSLHPRDATLQTMIEDHIPNLERKSYSKIARDLGVEMDEVIRAAKLIATLNPKPGRAFASDEARYITPDIYIYKVDEEYIPVLNEDGLPKLKISNYYREELKRSGSAEINCPADVKLRVRDILYKEKEKERKAEKGEDVEPPLDNEDILHLLEAEALECDLRTIGRIRELFYIQEKLRGAMWLVRSIHQRQSTILKVTESIIKFQRDFFDKGTEFLKPLVLRDVAVDIGMHESTVSRVTTNKYVHTPRGTYELKYFFNSSITHHGGEDLASEAVKAKIREIIGGENPKKPLSDAKIATMLMEQDNIEIARRTVAKYREMMGILSSAKRKQMF